MSLSAVIKTTALVVALGIPSFVARDIEQQYQQELHAAEVSTSNTTRALEAHAARTFETVDTYLQAVISLIGSRTASVSPEVIHKALRDRLAQSQHLTNILILDADGAVLHEAGAFPARAADRSQHDYLLRLRADPNAGLFVGQPIVGRFSSLPILPVARRIDHPDGSFAGVIVATLRPTAFQSVFDAFDLGPGSTVGLWRSDGTLLVRAPHVPALIGKNYASTENYKRYVVPKQTKPFWAVGSTDGIERVLALGFVPSYPLYVSATQSRETALGGWRRSAWTQGTIAGGLTLVLVVSLLALAREIKRRQLVDVQLRAAEREARVTTGLLQTTLDNMEQGLIEIDADGLVQVCNRRARQLLHLPEALTASRPSFGRVLDWQVGQGESDGPGSEFARFRAEGTGPGGASVFERECRDGTVLEVRTAALTHGGAVRTYTDITQRRRSEQAFKDSEARYRLLAEAATDMIVLTDVEGVRQYVSPASRDLLGHEPEDLVGTRVVAMGHPEDAERLAGIFASLRDGSVDQASSVNRLRRKDGSYIWVEAKLKLVRDAGTGRPSGIICAVRDISDRQKKAEELSIAKEAAEAGARAKGDFLASMSHELRTPLNSIIGFSGLMIQGEMTLPTMQRYARLVHDASTTLLSIVNDVLDVSKMEAGSFELDPQAFSPRDLIEGAAILLDSQAQGKGLTLQVEADPAVPQTLIGDDARLRQVLLNLLSNAVKFTAKGRVRLVIGCEGETGGLARIRFTVSDTGIGIPRDKHHRLFQRFSQVDSSTARQFGGTGLGLSICKSLVEIMGGTIEVESAEGEGSNFSFVLDLPVGTAAAESYGRDLPGHGTARSDGAHILLAEDVPMNQELAVAMLTQWGHTVDVVADGAAALDAVMQSRYDLVLMDMQMPGMDGLEATRRIRHLGGALATLPVIAMTANVMPRDVERCHAAGVDDHIGKPFVPAKLKATVEQWARVSGVATASDIPAHNPRTLAELRDLLGPAAITAMLHKFEAELDGRLTQQPGDPAAWQTIRFDAHALVSSAGLLGFDRLSDACMTMERICALPASDARGAHAQFERIRDEIAWAKRMIPQMVEPRAA